MAKVPRAAGGGIDPVNRTRVPVVAQQIARPSGLRNVPANVPPSGLPTGAENVLPTALWSARLIAARIVLRIDTWTAGRSDSLTVRMIVTVGRNAGRIALLSDVRTVEIAEWVNVRTVRSNGLRSVCRIGGASA